MIIFLHGKDSFRARQQLYRLKAKFFADKDPQRLNCNLLQANSVSDHEVLMQIGAAPFLAEKRMVIVDSILSSKNVSLASALTAMIKGKKIPDFCILVFIDEVEKPKIKEMKALYEVLMAEQYAQKFDLVTGSKLFGWVVSEVQARGGNISKPAADSITASINGNMWQVHNVIDQLVAYKQKETIQLEDVALFMEKPVDDNIFLLIDAIVSKKGKDVFALIEKQYEEGNDPSYIFAMLLRQFRIMLLIVDIQSRNEGLASADIAAALKIHPFVVKKTLPLLKKYSLNKLQEIHGELLQIDTQTKTGQGQQSALIDQFVGRCCS